jgi:hypothetical protein
MSSVLVGASLFTFVGLGTPAIFFLSRSIPLRHKRPELLQNGLWFMFPFLLMPLTFLFTIILVPASIVIVLLSTAKADRKGALFYAAMGEVAASIFTLSLLFIVNTFFLPQH